MGFTQEWRGNKVLFKNDLYSRCARKQSTPSLQTPAGKRVATSLLGHISLVALCSLATSQLGRRA